MAEPTDMHLPSSSARTQTGLVAHCRVCGIQWQVQSPDRADTKGCAFCGASGDAIVIENEANAHSATIYNT